MGWACGMYGGRRGAYRVLVGRPERKRPLGGPMLIWDNNIKNGTVRSEMGRHGLDCCGVG